MDSERWKLVKRLFEGALERPAAARASYLDQVTGVDAELRAEVDSLLAAHDQASGRLDNPVWAAVDLDRDPWEGRRVDQYQIGTVIGRGGMGVVYAAQDVDLGRSAALKFLNEDLARDEVYLERFRREARAASTLNHPNVCTVYGWGSSAARPFIAMELLQGRSLKEELAQAPLTPVDWLACALQLADALVVAHAAGITHRDLKPANIFLTSRGIADASVHAKILDFGLAASAHPESGLTQTGCQLGTTAYMSPEQARGEPLDPRTDLFSLGGVLLEMATGKPAFGGATPAIVMDAVLNRAPEGLDCLPSRVRPIVARLLEKRREARYPNAAALHADLKRVQQGGRILRVPTRARLGLAAGLILLTTAILLWRPSGNPAITSLAVLPLSNDAAGTQADYLIDGISESLIQKLSRLPKLRVMARFTVFRYKDARTDPLAAGRELKVEAVLAGRVRQRGDTLIIDAELVNTADGARLWGQRFEHRLADLQPVEEDIAGKIAAGLHMRLNDAEQKRLTRRESVNAEAYQLYVQGRYFWNKRNALGFQKALALFQQAVALDPNFALAHAGIADCYILLHSYGLMDAAQATPAAEDAARRALAIDNTLAEAHTSLAFIEGMHHWNFAAADAAYRRAIALNPSYATAHQWYSIMLTALLRAEEAIREIRAAVELDPVSLIIHSDYAMDLLMLRRYDEALRECSRTLELDPAFATAHWYRGAIYTRLGRHEEAITELDIGARATFGDAATNAKLALSYAHWGKTDRALQLAEALRKSSTDTPDAACSQAAIYSSLGRIEDAIRSLDQAFRGHAGCIVWLKASYEFDGMRSDPRFLDIMRRAGLM